MPDTRKKALVAVVMLTAAAGVARLVLHFADRPTGLPPGRCEVETTSAVTTELRDQPRAVMVHEGFTWVLVTAPEAPPPRVGVRVVRIPPRGPGAVMFSGHARSAEAVTGFVMTPEGPAFAVADGRDVKLRVFRESAPNQPREVAFPRGESPPGRDALTPALALTQDETGVTSALARWPSPYGVHRLHTRDTRESVAYTPRRRDRWHAPDVSVQGEVVYVAQERAVGNFTDASVTRTEVELAWMDAQPAVAALRAVIPLARGAQGHTPRVCALDATDTSRGVAVVWRDEAGVSAARVGRPEPGRVWQAEGTLRVADDRAMRAHTLDVAPAGACGHLAAWLRGDALVAHVFDLTAGRAGAEATVAIGPSGEENAARVRAERTQNRTFVATDTAQGVKVYEAVMTPGCALTLRAVALPATGTGARMVGFAASGDRAVLSYALTPAGAPEARVGLVTLWDDGRAAVGRAAAVVPMGAVDMTLLDGNVPVIVGPAHGSVQLLRLDDPGDDDEPGEDLLLRGMRGAELAIASSFPLKRVWVADVAGDEENDFGPPGAVVVHSAIDGLEDGPRTEVRTSVAPEAEFARITLDAGAGAWATTGSGGVATPDTGACVPGAWVSLRARVDDRPITFTPAPQDSPWPWARALVPADVRACGDRVQSIVWNNSFVAATLRGERLGARLALGDVTAGEVRTVALDERQGAQPRVASVARAGAGYLAVWLEGASRSPSLRYRMFAQDGSARGAVGVLGEITESPSDTLDAVDGMPLAHAGGDRWVTVMRTIHGPRVAKLKCGAW